MLIIKIFLVGVVVLIGAIALNLIATKLPIKTWYDFIADPASTSLLSYFWLFVVYPLCLGLVAYGAQKFLLP